MKKFKPMQGIKSKNVEFPVMVSNKLSGVRVIFKDGEMLLEDLTVVPNNNLHKRFDILIEYSKDNNTIFDGVLYSENLSKEEITFQTMSQYSHIDETLEFHCFDCVIHEDFETPFVDRYHGYMSLLDSLPYVRMVENWFITNEDGINGYLKTAKDDDYNGVILRHPLGRYKFGKSTKKEGLLIIKE